MVVGEYLSDHISSPFSCLCRNHAAEVKIMHDFFFFMDCPIHKRQYDNPARIISNYFWAACVEVMLGCSAGPWPVVSNPPASQESLLPALPRWMLHLPPEWQLGELLKVRIPPSSPLPFWASLHNPPPPPTLGLSLCPPGPCGSPAPPCDHCLPELLVLSWGSRLGREICLPSHPLPLLSGLSSAQKVAAAGSYSLPAPLQCQQLQMNWELRGGGGWVSAVQSRGGGPDETCVTPPGPHLGWQSLVVI